MYSTWPRSLLKKDVNALSEAPSSEGPNSGFLVLQDEAAQSYWFFEEEMGPQRITTTLCSFQFLISPCLPTATMLYGGKESIKGRHVQVQRKRI